MNTLTPASPAQLEILGTQAARLVQPGQRVGLGSGRAALAFVRALGKRCREEKLDILGIPTSLLTERTARESGIPLSTLERTAALDIMIDGADEVDPALNLIKGGGGNLLREKVVVSITREFVVVVGGEKIVQHLGTSFPVFVEVLEFARAVVTRKLEAMGATVRPRTNPDGTIFLTDNGNPYLEPKFPIAALQDPAALDLQLHAIPGILETGLFIGRAQEVLVAHSDGRIERKRRPPL